MTPARNPHGALPFAATSSWDAMLRLADVARCHDETDDASLDRLVRINANQSDGHWELLQAVRALLRAEGLR